MYAGLLLLRDRQMDYITGGPHPKSLSQWEKGWGEGLPQDNIHQKVIKMHIPYIQTPMKLLITRIKLLTSNAREKEYTFRDTARSVERGAR
jgi:hypothetical protein